MSDQQPERPTFGDSTQIAFDKMLAKQRVAALKHPHGLDMQPRPDVFSDEELEKWFQPSKEDPQVFVPKEKVHLPQMTLPVGASKYGEWYRGPETEVIGGLDEPTVVDVLSVRRPKVEKGQSLGPAPSWMVKDANLIGSEYFVARRGIIFIGVNGTK